MIWATIKQWAGVAGAAIVALLAAFIYRSGYNARQAKQDRADAKAARTVEKSRTDARGSSDDELNAQVDKWTRK